MLIRQGGGYDNIKEYLENGLKQGSYVHRDVKDKRVILDGDLDIVNQFIQSIESNGERYTHFTASFKEDEISVKDLDFITQELKKFFGAAYVEDEFQFYAEAHLPKIKSYIDHKTGKEITRKPHIHIIIPKRNVLDGSYLNPMGFYKNNVKYIEAIQEKLNIDLNLQSPKDNRRADLTDASDILSRYKGDIFKSDPKKLKERILNKIFEAEAKDWQEFEALANEFGKVTIRNKGRDNKYLNVRPEGASKGVNLKELVFSKPFIESSKNEKVLTITGGTDATSKRDLQKELSEYKSLLKEWHGTRSHEIRHMNPNSNEWKKYKKLTPGEKKEAIEKYIKESQKKASTIKCEIMGEPKHPAELLIKLLTQEDINNDLSLSNLEEHRNNRSLPPPQRRDRLYSLQECSLVDNSERGVESVVPHIFRSSVANEGESETGGWYDDVRWDVYSEELESHHLDVDHIADGTAEYYLYQLYEEREQQQQAADVDWRSLQNSLDLDEFLNSLSHSHGIERNLYKVTSSKNGDGRIQFGKRRYSPSDFLTKVINLDWREAQNVLKEASKSQTSDIHEKARERQTQRKFWSEFKTWQYTSGNSYKEHWARQRDSERMRFKSLRQNFKQDRSRHFTWNASPLERNASLSILRLKKIAEEEDLRNQIKKERRAFASSMAIDERYKEFLRSKILAGDEEALEEYRRHVKELQQRKALAVMETPDSKNSLLMGYTFEVNRDGSVIYFLNDTKMVADNRDWVTVLEENNEDAIEIALRLTLEKFNGKPIILSGSTEFKKRVAEVALKRNISVTFDDPEVQQYFKTRVQAANGTASKAEHSYEDSFHQKRSSTPFRP